MASNEYLHMRFKNNAIACFSRTDETVDHIEAQKQLDRHGDTAEIWLYRTQLKDWHRFERRDETSKEGRWVKYGVDKVPEEVVQYVKLTSV